MTVVNVFNKEQEQKIRNRDAVYDQLFLTYSWQRQEQSKQETIKSRYNVKKMPVTRLLYDLAILSENEK